MAFVNFSDIFHWKDFIWFIHELFTFSDFNHLKWDQRVYLKKNLLKASNFIVQVLSQECVTYILKCQFQGRTVQRSKYHPLLQRNFFNILRKGIYQLWLNHFVLLIGQRHQIVYPLRHLSLNRTFGHKKSQSSAERREQEGSSYRQMEKTRPDEIEQPKGKITKKILNYFYIVLTLASLLPSVGQ